MSVRFLHISLDPHSDVDRKALEKKFDLSMDWIRYFPNNWIIKTKIDTKKWYERIKPMLGPKDYVFICKLDLSDRQGWLPKLVWEWIQKNYLEK